MYLLIPMDGTDIEESKLTKVFDATVWAQVNIEEGSVKSIEHSEKFDGFANLSEAVVLISDGENPMPFLEYSMMPLVAHTQRYIDDIVEAYLFRELHDMAY